MVGVIIVILIFVIIIYVYMRHKSRKNSVSNINTVQDYHDAHKRIMNRKELRDKQNTYQTYITKYNSSEDYREKL